MEYVGLLDDRDLEYQNVKFYSFLGFFDPAEISTTQMILGRNNERYLLIKADNFDWNKDNQTAPVGIHKTDQMK